MSFSVEKIYETPSYKGTRVVVLWASRHPPLKAQIAELERRFGAIAVYQMSGVIPNAESVADVASKVNASVIVPILPLSMLVRLVELRKQSNNFVILFAKMSCIATVRDVAEAQKIIDEAPSRRSLATHADGLVRVYEFLGFEKLIEIRLITEPL
jgi:hypothetical protein